MCKESLSGSSLTFVFLTQPLTGRYFDTRFSVTTNAFIISPYTFIIVIISYRKKNSNSVLPMIKMGVKGCLK